jgi:cytochrome c-type protein NapC
MLRKMDATRKELWAWAIGRIDTREEFDARRADLARNVWASMKATDSRECRACHDAERMDYAQQDRYAARRHKRGFEQGQTCIDCHTGVAHVLPEGLEEAEQVGADDTQDNH